MGDHFFRTLLKGSLPLLIWTVHFAICYLLTAARCTPAGYVPGGVSRVFLGIVTLIALAACAVLVWRVRGVLRHGTEKTALLDWMVAVTGVLSLVGIAWTGLPLLIASGCD